MSWKRIAAVLLMLAGLSAVLSGCGQSGSGGHMMNSGMMAGGMMGGGMMGQTSSENGSQTLPDPQSDGAQLLTQYCGQCHVPPAPSAHSAKEWPQVVERMRGYMITQEKLVPDRAKIKLIVAYLQQHAR